MTVVPNGFAKPRNRICIWALALISLGATVSFADEINITRIGQCDWICADTQSVQLSCHVRVDRAITACANRSLADGLEYRVRPAEYRVQATITVTEPVAAVTLTWDSPTTYTDGSPLTALLTFPVYLMADGPLQIGETNALTFAWQPPGPGTYTFAVSAVADSIESELSEPASIVR